MYNVHTAYSTNVTVMIKTIGVMLQKCNCMFGLMISSFRMFNQLIQCLKPILDVMLLLLLIIATFSLAGN